MSLAGEDRRPTTEPFTQSADVPSLINSPPIAVQDTVTFATTVYSKRLLLHLFPSPEKLFGFRRIYCCIIPTLLLC